MTACTLLAKPGTLLRSRTAAVTLCPRREASLVINLPALPAAPNATIPPTAVQWLSCQLRIAEAHGGCLWAENNPSGGAIFSLTVPLSSAHLHLERTGMLAGRERESNRRRTMSSSIEENKALIRRFFNAIERGNLQ